MICWQKGEKASCSGPQPTRRMRNLHNEDVGQEVGMGIMGIMGIMGFPFQGTVPTDR
uniref:GG11442 n=1 Tax=Drosophila erecta TaxID=7220 RepID=B3P6C7_DROER